MPSENNGPPPANPVLTAYESYLRSTPLITRYVLNSILISFFVGFLFNPGFLLANTPQFTIFRFQLYRIVTSPFVCSDVLSLLFAFMGFLNNGVQLEQSMGSSLFAMLFLTLTTVSNMLFLALNILLWGLTNSNSYVNATSSGIWTVLLGIISVECSEAPQESQRRLFFLEVQSKYYPLVLLALFSMLAGLQMSYCLGVAAGYAYGYGKLDKLKVKVETVRKWENREQGGCLSGFVNRTGFITLDMANGPNAWLIGSGRNDSESGGLAPVRAPADPATPSFPRSGGRSLGSRGAKAPQTSEERAALLERAADRRRQRQSELERDEGV